MSGVFITGSADGLGQMAARLLVDAGHQVVLHARSAARAEQALRAVPQAQAALIDKPQRLVYLSSGLHRSGDASLDDLAWERRPWQGTGAYSDSKLHDALLAFAIARRWPGVLSNALEPGWVATKMGGAGAPDDLQAAPKTQVWLAVSDEPAATVSGAYFYHMKPRETHPALHDVAVQERLIQACEVFSGIRLPD
ncbi:hypothetical protein LMG28614_01313 [Paraburkholderia ultramafica]|uniref:Short-chain dehydrogenase n=1 Tax=Paraburkholderia ultramafica TaxID=1544867 RepID=A0A6S7B797_9BURK|nr:SDR family NAD(P)-dependent oxidoreductase [Paraburkholderia ultramafica]CAB3781899.1 hypothetical protein LMG28614_01313 [Paraburkholderia ultramafica]